MNINNPLSALLRSADGVTCATINTLVVGHNNVGPISQKIIAQSVAAVMVASADIDHLVGTSHNTLIQSTIANPKGALKIGIGDGQDEPHIAPYTPFLSQAQHLVGSPQIYPGSHTAHKGVSTLLNSQTFHLGSQSCAQGAFYPIGMGIPPCDFVGTMARKAHYHQTIFSISSTAVRLSMSLPEGRWKMRMSNRGAMAIMCSNKEACMRSYSVHTVVAVKA